MGECGAVFFNAPGKSKRILPITSVLLNGASCSTLVPRSWPSGGTESRITKSDGQVSLLCTSVVR